MTEIIPFKVPVETLICGHCKDQEGLFYISTDFIAFCSKCSWTVKLNGSTYPDWREINDLHCD
jgi:hypothetical protein